MSKPNCYLCASDEGMLLDIFGDAGKTFRENIETCLSVKVKRGDARCTKICHKCAYELESCSRFLDKYRRSRDSEGAAAYPKREYCRLCAVTGDKVRLLRVNGGNSLKNSLRKIGQVIKEDLFKDKVADFAVCLDCRYNVDLLFDLRSIYGETPKKLESLDENGLSPSDLPKTRTSVVLRKTTYIPSPRLNGDRDSDASTASSGTMSLKRKRGKPRKESVGTGAVTAVAVHFRCCEQCDTQVEHGIDMYRYHRTGLTVCKECWLTMDPERVSSGKRKRLAQLDPEGGTKLCAVFLKDVLTNPSKYKNIYKLEKDKHGNTTYLITDESSENEDKTPPKRTRGRPPTSSLATHGATEGRRAAKRQLLAKRNDEETPKRGRPATKRSAEPPESPPIAKVKPKNGVAEVETPTTRTRTRRGSVEPAKVASASPESRGSGVKKPGTRKPGRPPKIVIAKRSSSGDEKPQTRAESAPNPTRTEIDTPRITRARKTSTPEQPTKIISTPEQPTKRTSRRTRSNSFTDPVTTKPLATRRLDALPEETPEAPPIVVDPITPKTQKTRPKIAKSDSELDKPYTCSVCQAGYANKLIGKAHELTHEKQPEVKLRRVVVPPETIAEDASPEASEKASEVANESCNVDGNPEEHAEKPSVEKEATRPLTPHITEIKDDPEETLDTSTIVQENEKTADDKEKDERDESDETEISLALRDTSDDEAARTEDEVKTLDGDEKEAQDDRNEAESGKNNVDDNGEDAKTKDDIDESPSVTEPREIENVSATTCDEPKKTEASKPDVNTTSAEDIERDATESKQATLRDKVEPEYDEKVANCAVKTVPPIDDEPVKDVEDTREIGKDSEDNLKYDVAAKPEVNDPVNDCSITTKAATDQPKVEAQSDGKIDDRSVAEEKPEEKKTERQEHEEEKADTEEEKETEARGHKENVEEAKTKSGDDKEQEEQEKKSEVRTNEKDEDTEDREEQGKKNGEARENEEDMDTEEREEQGKKNGEARENEEDMDTEEREENEKEVNNGKVENAEEREENEKEEVKTNEQKKDPRQREEEKEEVEEKREKERKNVAAEKDEEERKKVTEEKDKEEDEEKKEEEDDEQNEKVEDEEEKTKVEDEVEKKKVDEKEKVEDEEETEKMEDDEETEKVGDEEETKKVEDEEEKEKVEDEQEKEKVEDEEEKEKVEDEKETEKVEDDEEKEKVEHDEETEGAEGENEAEKVEDEEEKDTDERKGNDHTNEEEKAEEEKHDNTEKEPIEENEKKTEKESNAKDNEEAEKAVKTNEGKEDALLDIELRKETTDEAQKEIDRKVESVGVATEVLREVFDLASAEVKKRLEKNNLSEDNCATPETLENISLEIQNSAETPERSASNDKS